ncbi:MAG: ABC transporter ATP-binding protein, partial [Clostridia bacterium]|nr:ABC transporter ATP-binding protein [Clostridia bacterium]
MLKVLKNLKKSFISVFIIVILLCIQAWTDLALPDFTSKIVNNGIQAGGIETPIPDVLTKENMELIKIFSSENDYNSIIKNYRLVGDIQTKDEKEKIEKYFGNEYQISANQIYTLNNINEQEKNKLISVLTSPLMGL